MNLNENIEIYIPKGSIYENEVMKYPNSKSIAEPDISKIFHKEKVQLNFIAFSKKTKKQQRLEDQEVTGLICIVDEKFTDYASQLFSIRFRKELKGNLLFLDRTEESRSILRRIIHAYKIKATEDILVKAVIYQDANSILLQVTGADLTEYTIDSRSISSLARLTFKELQKFEIDEYGFDIHWPLQDIHLNLESFKIVDNPKLLKRRMKEIASEKESFGNLMKKFRERHGQLSQKDFGTLSERQIRKYENGENYPSYDALKIISEAFKMNVNEYLNALNANE